MDIEAKIPTEEE